MTGVSWRTLLAYAPLLARCAPPRPERRADVLKRIERDLQQFIDIPSLPPPPTPDHQSRALERREHFVDVGEVDEDEDLERRARLTPEGLLKRFDQCKSPVQVLAACPLRPAQPCPPRGARVPDRSTSRASHNGWRITTVA